MKKQQQKTEAKQTKAIRSKEEVATHPDPRIDQDFPGFPHNPSKEKIINPQNGEDKATADLVKETTKKKSKAGNKEVLRKELDAVSKRKKKR